MNPTMSAVIFDMDGVLTDSEPLINAAAIAMFREHGLVVQPEDFLSFVGYLSAGRTAAWRDCDYVCCD
jgi:beta-phosphoglucomutase-like phosphatase (HAD superfamily)